ncbi:MAG: hypothetical protein E7220_06465, partial [Clostridiales bacterium]|nr:hypothetical protein [Clostridiales bacterium]
MCSERRWLLSIVLTIAMSVTMLFNPAWMMVSYADSEDIVVLDEGTTEDGFVYDYVNSDGEKMIRITGYTGDSDVLDVPAEIGDYPVKAFIISTTDDDSYANITEIHFPETMLYVDTDGLDSFSGLESISGPDGEDFDNTAYKTADGVLYRHLKNGFSVAYYPRASEMTEWDMDPDTHALYAEVSNPNLEVINMPAALHAMDLEVLRGFSSLEAINVDSDNLDYSSEDGVLYSKDFGTLYFYPTAKPGDAYTVNSNTTDIHWSAFFAGHLCETITLPEGIRTADSECFGNDPDKCAVRTIVFTSEKAPKDFSRFRGVREAVEYLGADIEFPENGTGYEEFREGLSSGGFVTPPEDCPELTIGEEVEGETEDGSEIVTYKITTPEPVTEDDEDGEDNWEQYILTVTRFGTGATAGGEMRACIFEAGAEYDQLNTESNGSTLTDETELKLGKEYYLQIDTGAGCGYKVLLSKYQSSNNKFPGIPEDCEEIGLDEEKTASIIKDNDVVTYAFTPESDGVYYFSAQGSYDTLGRVITASEEADQGFEQVAYDDDTNSGNFLARFQAEAGTTYYLQARMYSRGTGRFPVKVSKGVDFADVPENCDDAPLKRDVPINFSDGTETITYRFKAPATTDYRIRSTGRLNLNMRLIRDGEVVPYGNEYDESSNFYCNLEAESGEVYYIQIISPLGETGSSSFIIEFYPEFSGLSPEDKLIEEGVTETVEDTTPYDTESFRFIPETSGEYTISTEGCSDKDLRVEYYDEENDEQYGAGWSYSEDTEGGDFFRNYYLEEGKEYYIQILDRSGEASTYDLKVVKADDYYQYSEPEGDEEEINVGDEKDVNIDVRNKTVTYSFTPSRPGEYVFASTGECVTQGRVIDSEGMLIAQNDWSGDQNFSFVFYVETGQTYYLQTKLANIGTGAYKVSLEPKPDFDDIDISSEDIEMIQLNESKAVDITEPGGSAAFKFSPEEAGTYMFISTGDKDTAGRLVDEYGGGEWNDDYNGSKNFALQFYADPEGVYTLQAGLKAGDTGSFNVKVIKVDGSYSELDPDAELIDINGIYGPAFENPFETATYRFKAKEYTSYYFELYGADKADLRVIDSSGDAVADTRVNGGDFAYFYTYETGTYYLQIRRINGETGRLKFRLHRSTYDFDTVPDDCETIAAGETKTAKIDQLEKTVTYEFVPVESGQYSFSAPAGSRSSGRVIDGGEIYYNSAEDADDYFSVDFYGIEGKTYYLQTRSNRTEYGSIPVTLSRSETINMSSSSARDRTEYIYQYEFVYDGEEHKPSIIVKYDGKTLEEGTDYTVDYPEESVRCNDYEAKITFTGAFSGEHWSEYWIECYHNYDDGVITKDPTCTDIGSLEFTCSVCGDTFTRDIDPLGHAWDESIRTTP